MARRRGFFAELQHQNQLAARRGEQAARATYQANLAAQRQAEQARRQFERAQTQADRSSAAAQKAAEREAKQLHDQAMTAEAASLNAQLASTYEEIDTILGATLAIDDYVDLGRLRTVAQHPPFARTDLQVPIPPPVPASPRAEPWYAEPPAPRGFGGKKKHAELVARVQASFAADHEAWRQEVAEFQQRQIQEHQAAEQQRLAWLDHVWQEYQAECRQREAEAAEANSRLDALILGLARNEHAAVQEYVGIVLGNSTYPDCFPVDHEYEFDAELKELTLTVLVPPPEAIPSQKQYKYVRSSNEITATALPKKDQKDRYCSAIYQVAVRSLHEVFEADRAGRIQTIALTVATEALDPATGLARATALVAVAAERNSFLTFDLSNIVPLSTLQHLGASISKDPFALIGIDGTQGVRQR